MLIFSQALRTIAHGLRRANFFNRLVALSVLTSVAVPASAETVAWWRFEEGRPNTRAAGTGRIFDLSGNYSNGTALDDPMYRASPVKDSSLALQFTGGHYGTQRIFVPDNPTFYLTKSLTLEAYIRYDGKPMAGTHASQIIFRGDSRDALDPYTLAITNEGILFLDISSLTQRVVLLSPTALPLGKYIHVAGTLDNETGAMKLFVNGVEVASQITDVRPFGALTGPDPGIGIGNVQSNSSNQAFGGIIDEVRISNVALSPSQLLIGDSLTDILVPELDLSN